MIEQLYAEISARKETPKAGSYTNYLFDQGLDKILKKVGEEATEVVIAAKNESNELICETSDLVYHLLVLLVNQRISIEEINQELKKRAGKLSRTTERKEINEL